MKTPSRGMWRCQMRRAGDVTGRDTSRLSHTWTFNSDQHHLLLPPVCKPLWMFLLLAFTSSLLLLLLLLLLPLFLLLLSSPASTSIKQPIEWDQFMTASSLLQPRIVCLLRQEMYHSFYVRPKSDLSLESHTQIRLHQRNLWNFVDIWLICFPLCFL